MTSSPRFNAQRVARLSRQSGEHFDPQTPGFGIRVRKNGHASWVLLYRLGGLRRRWTIAALSDMTLKDARTKAEEGRTRVAKGEDPASDKRREVERVARARANSIEILCARFIDEHGKQHKRTWRDDQSKITCEILPVWKGRSVTSIERRDCSDLVQAIADRPAPVYADRVAALLSRLFRFAIDKFIRKDNPAAGLPKHTRTDGNREEKAYDDAEIRAIWKATEDVSPALRAIYRLGLLTGQRPGEISGLEWSEIDGTWWTIPGSRTKNGRAHRVSLTPLALKVLADVSRMDGKPRAFHGYLGKRQIAEVNATVFGKVRRRKKPRHALRSTVATGLAAGGVSVEDIAKVLNHARGPRVTAGYNEYAYDKEKRIALETWDRVLHAILTEKKSGTVVPITATRGKRAARRP